MDKLPPLNAVRAFLAAGASLSFTKAARDLQVTQGAVSQQIRILEQYLGVPLFLRRHNALNLTEAGSRLLPVLQDAFFTVAEASEAVRAKRPPGTLRISSMPGFAHRWLLPRLKPFCDANPDIEIQLISAHRSQEFPHGEADVAIRMGAHWPDLDATYLMETEITPVCSPQLLRLGRGLRRPEDVLHYTRLHATTGPDDWSIWLNAAGVASDHIGRGVRLDSFVLVIEAAIAGIGIAVVRRALVGEDLAQGRLVAPFTLSVPTGEAWHLLCPPSFARRPEILRFRDWLLAEVKEANQA